MIFRDNVGISKVFKTFRESVVNANEEVVDYKMFRKGKGGGAL